MSEIEARGYARPEVLVSIDWVQHHLDDPGVRIIESNEDTLLYASGHLPGAVDVDWTSDLNDQVRRDYITRDGFERLMSRIGATRDMTAVFYGDKNNWWACYAFWVFQLFGHTKATVMDGGRLKWEKEKRPMTRDVPSYPPTTNEAPELRDTPIPAQAHRAQARPRAALHGGRDPHARCRHRRQRGDLQRHQRRPAQAAPLQRTGRARRRLALGAGAANSADEPVAVDEIAITPLVQTHRTYRTSAACEHCGWD